MIARTMVIWAITAVFIAWPPAIPMGGSEPQSSLNEPSFSPLEEGDETYDACIKEGQKSTHVKQFSFFGHTTLGGIRTEADTSVTKLDLANIRSITVLEPSYSSKRYPEKDFCLIRKVSKDGVVSDNLLMPRHVVICGIEKSTGDEKAWYLSKINEIVIERSPMPIPEPNTKAPALQKIEPENKIAEKPVQPSNTQVAPKQEDAPAQSGQTMEFPRQQASIDQLQQKTDSPLVVKEQYKEKEIVVIEKKASDGDISSIWYAFIHVFESIGDFFKSIYTFIKSLLIQ
jgi:hypothetical protein